MTKSLPKMGGQNRTAPPRWKTPSLSVTLLWALLAVVLMTAVLLGNPTWAFWLVAVLATAAIGVYPAYRRWLDRPLAALSRSREELAQSRARLASILANMSEGVVVSDLSGQVLEMNPVALALHGYADPEEARRRLPELAENFELRSLDGSPLPLDEWPLSRVLRGEAFTELEIVVRRRDGSATRILSYSGNPVRDAGGRAILALLTIRDVSERRRMEDRLRESERLLEQRVRARTAELEAANKELEAFSYSVSHDLRAPLRAINGFSHILLQDYAPQMPAEVQRLLARIHAGSGKMGQLIDDLLDLARLGRQPVKKRRISLDETVRQCLEELRGDWEGRAVQFEIAELGGCEADPTLIRQVFINLLSNALKYSRRREPAKIEMGALQSDGERIVFVRDNGAGFDPSNQAKLFGAFQRLHRTEEFEGTGVGLAIVERIVHRHGGRVWAESEPDRGATFYVVLPETALADPQPTAIQ